jgi:DNA repair exonuclease SbcCD ATPase subunit
MRLIRLEVQNFCQHRHKVVEFNPRLTAFLGQNGSGKSNLLTAALGALTNDFSRTHGNKAENICQTAPESEPSYVKLLIEHDGSEVEIQRGFRKAQSYWQQGEDTIRGDTAVTARVLEFLGTTKRIINDYLFVDQGEIFTPLVCKEADRARAFQQLFGTGHAEKCWKALGEFVASIPTVVSALDIDMLRQELESVRGRVVELTTELAGIDLPEDYTPDTDPARQVIANWGTLQAAFTDKAVATSSLEAGMAELATLTSQGALLEEENNALIAAIATIKDQHDEATLALQTWDLREQSVVRVEKMQADLVNIREEQASNPVPEKPESYVEDIPEWQRRTGALEAKRGKHLAMITALDTATGVVECPTCGTAVSDLEMDIEYARVAADKLSVEIEERHTTQQLSVTYNISSSEWSSWNAAWQSRATAVEEALAAEPASDQAEELSVGQRAKYEQVQRSMAERKSVHDSIVLELTQVRLDISAESAAVQIQQAVVDQLIATIEELESGLDEEAVAIAQRAVEANRLAYASRIRLQGQRDEASVAVGASQDRLDRAEETARQAEINTEFVSHLDSVRDILHRDNLPKLVAQNYLELLEEDINGILESFGTDYRVSARDGLGFIADFPDGRSQPVPRLSGGQKVVLALAFRISVNSLFASDLGVITLDEPTAYLDDENINCLDLALARLRSLSEARGLQCILITHEKGLSHLFDHVVQL